MVSSCLFDLSDVKGLTKNAVGVGALVVRSLKTSQIGKKRPNKCFNCFKPKYAAAISPSSFECSRHSALLRDKLRLTALNFRRGQIRTPVTNLRPNSWRQ